jgi:hypothetical protein
MVAREFERQCEEVLAERGIAPAAVMHGAAPLRARAEQPSALIARAR